jgi:16S rRNA (cytosine1402-N4)-methyltransferase
MSFTHKSVLLDEALELLDTGNKGGIYVDATLGLGGHSEAILNSNSNCTVIGLDLDSGNLAQAEERLKNFKDAKRFTAVKENFRNLDTLLDSMQIEKIDGIIYDLGVSSAHFDDASRGFSFSKEAPLDMRLDREQQLSAHEVVNKYRHADLERIIKEYGEDYKARKIADYIIKNRPIETTTKLADVVKQAKWGVKEQINPATKTFQAIRIEVNDELGALKESLKKALIRLKQGGRIAVISFHSLEDRIVKQYFAREASDCVCENKRMPCNCGHKASIKLLTKKAVVPSEAEVRENARARSAKLRAAERL